MNRELEGKVSFRRGGLTTTADSITTELRNATATVDTITAADRNNIIYYTGAATQMVVNIPIGLGEGFSFQAINLSGGDIDWTCTATGILDGAGTATAFRLQNAAGRNRIDCFVAATRWFTSRRRFVSENQSITGSAALVIAHGLGAQPDHIMALLTCVGATGDAGYALGDEVMTQPTCAGVESGPNVGMSCVPDDTNLNIRFGSATTPIVIANKTTGVQANAVVAQWRLVLTAEF